MGSRAVIPIGLSGILLLTAITGGIGLVSSADSHSLSLTVADPSTPPDAARSGEQHDLSTRIVVQEEAEDAEKEEEAEDGEEGEGAQILGDWWGLAGEAREASYIGFVELGVVLLVVGVGGYSLAKRRRLVPPRYRRYLLPAHEGTVLAGTALTVPHFLASEWEGLGVLVGVLLGIEVLSGLYGRHLHRHVILLGRGEETAPLVGRAVERSTKAVFARWRKIHISLTLVTALVLLLHVVTAIGE